MSTINKLQFLGRCAQHSINKTTHSQKIDLRLLGNQISNIETDIRMKQQYLQQLKQNEQTLMNTIYDAKLSCAKK
jgi:hypothetical protein